MHKLIIIFLLISSNLFATDTLRIRTFGDIHDNFAKDIIHTQDKGYIIVGSTYANENRKTDVYVVKLDSTFTRSWSFAHGKNNIDWATGVVEMPNKNLLICGYTNAFGYGGYDGYVLCLDSLGEFLWEKTYGGTDWDFLSDIIALKDGNYLLVGETYSFTNGSSDAYYLKITGTGDTLWTKHYGGAGKDIAHEVIQSHDSCLYICGQTDMLNTDSVNAFLLKLDKNEVFSWFKTYGGNREDIVYDLIETTDSNLVMAGSTSSPQPPFNSILPDLNQYLLKVDSAGTVLWEYGYAYSSSEPNKNDGYFSVTEKNNLFLFAGFTETYGYGEKDLSTTITDQGGWYQGGSSGGFYLSENYEKAITVNDKFVLLGNTNSWGQGNTDILVATFFNTNDTTVYEFVKDSAALPVKEVSTKIREVTIYPNPAGEFVFIESPLKYETAKVCIYDLFGNVVYHKETQLNKLLDVGFLSSGIYMLTLETAYYTFNQKLIIQK